MIDEWSAIDWHALGITTHRHLPEVNSTNDFARDLTHTTGARDWFPLLVTCDRQTSGRGRGGRRWWQTEGGLAFTIVTPLPTVARDDSKSMGRRASQLSIWTALCLQATAAHFLPQQNCRIKWPNDLMIQDRKNAGILIEPVVGDPDLVVVGIGVNVNNPMTEARDLADVETFSWAETDRTFSLPLILADFLQRWLWTPGGALPTLPELISQFSGVDWLLGKNLEVHAMGVWQWSADGQLEVAQNRPANEPLVLHGHYSGLTNDGHLRLTGSFGEEWIFPSVERVRPLS